MKFKIHYTHSIKVRLLCYFYFHQFSNNTQKKVLYIKSFAKVYDADFKVFFSCLC